MTEHQSMWSETGSQGTPIFFSLFFFFGGGGGLFVHCFYLLSMLESCITENLTNSLCFNSFVVTVFLYNFFLSEAKITGYESVHECVCWWQIQVKTKILSVLQTFLCVRMRCNRDSCCYKNQQSDVLVVILFDWFSENINKKATEKQHRERERVCVSARDWEGSCMFASTALVD